MSSEKSLAFRKELKSDFRKCLFYAWHKLKLPEPTPLQYDIADFIQQSQNPRIITEAFRGIGKSFILAAFCPWMWMLNHNCRIMVLSASKKRADNFARAVKRMVDLFPAFQYLSPGTDQRQSIGAFDVAPADVDQSPSLFSLGIGGQLTGSRADILICDDVETGNNSLTQSARDYLLETTKELASIVKPIAEGGRIIFLGTPQHEASLYNILRKEREYVCRVWPARYPIAKQMEGYEGSLAPTLAGAMNRNPTIIGQPTDPARFGEEELRRREAELGRSTFAMQFMMDTTLSDSERYPLKISDLVAMPLDTEKGPMRLSWSGDPHYIADGIPSVGFSGDVWRRPCGVNPEEYAPYTGSLMAIDPSGRGKDETAYVVIKELNARLFILACRGLPGGYDDATLKELAQAARLHRVNAVLIESNFGDGMFAKVFAPILGKVHPCKIEEIRSHTQKELRIIDTLEPLMNQHRLIVAEDVAIGDYRSSSRYEKQLFFQMTRLTRERGCLGIDDKIDVLGMGCQYWLEQMARDVDKASDRSIEEALEQEFEQWDRDMRGAKGKQSGWIRRP